MIIKARPAFSRLPSVESKLFRPKSFQCLREMDLFSNLPDQDLVKLISISGELRVRKGGFIARQDDSEREQLFVILDGEATVSWQNADGAESLLATLHSGDTVGETELFDPNSRLATVRAVSTVKLLAWHREDLLRELREKPELALGFLGDMARRLGQSNRRVSGICNQRVPRRVASVLVSLTEECGMRVKDAGGNRCILLTRRPTQRRIAELAGAARETISRLFAEWEGSGLFEDRSGGFRILDEPRLRHLAGEG